jgi:parvulin-like peptidyl-prolyl isomerase
MAPAMRKHVISATLLALLASVGCQAFTAGESVSEPDLSQARAARTAAEHVGKPEQHEAAKEAAPAPAAPEQATAAHILIAYAGAMRARPEITRTKEQAKQIASDLAGKAKVDPGQFAALADEYTDDPSGKGRGGKLGTFAKGRMVKEFDETVFALEPGGVSDVVETAFGFHVIYREK